MSTGKKEWRKKTNAKRRGPERARCETATGSRPGGSLSETKPDKLKGCGAARERAGKRGQVAQDYAKKEQQKEG